VNRGAAAADHPEGLLDRKEIERWARTSDEGVAAHQVVLEHGGGPGYLSSSSS